MDLRERNKGQNIIGGVGGQPEKIRQTLGGNEVIDGLKAASPSFPDLHGRSDSEEWRRALGQTARVMVRHGATRYLDFIIEKYPEAFQDFVEGNEDVQAIVQELGGNRKWLSLALARTCHLTYDNVYRAVRHSPIRPYIGDFTITPREKPLWVDPPIRVRAIDQERVDLTDIRREAYIEQHFGMFSQDADGYLQALQRMIIAETDDRYRRVWQGVYDFYQEVMDLSFPRLHPQISDQFGQPRRDKTGRDILFPSNHQKAAIVKAAREDSLAVFDGTGSGKTGIGIGLAEYVGAQRVLVICPANVKGSWEEKIGLYYKEKPELVRTEGSTPNGFIEKIQDGARYVITNYESLITRNGDNSNGEAEVLSPLAQKLLEVDFDLFIMDEGHYINNQNKRSDAVLELAKKIKRKLILTATPIRNSADDLARIAHLLEPNTFETPDALRELGPSGLPAITELLTQKTIRRKTEELLELPPFCPETSGEISFLQFALNPTQRAVYDAIFDDDSFNPFTKIRLLRLAVVDHNLVMGKHEVLFDGQEAARVLQKAYSAWRKQVAKGADISFNSDFLVLHGYKHLFVGAHFAYRRGISEFIQLHANNEVKNAWQGVVESSKFQKLRDLITQRLAKGEKVVVFSGHFVKGVLREIVDDVTGEQIMEDLYSYLKRSFPNVTIGRIDGDVSTKGGERKKSARDRERKRWQDDPAYKILLTNVQSSSLGIDFSINDGATTGAGVIGIDLPYTHADLWQMISRVYRFGQATPVRAWVLEGIGTIDQGVRGLIFRKKDVAEELLDGVSPDEIQRRLMDRSKSGGLLVEYVKSPKRQLEQMMYVMRGKGVVVNGEYLEQLRSDGKKVGQVLAELYAKYWEYTYSGHTARLVRQVLDGLQQGLGSKFGFVADAGSGPLVLERVVRQESEVSYDMSIASIDINKHMLEYGRAELEKLGYSVNRNLVLTRSMSNTGLQNGVCDAVVCSLSFHYSNSAVDRGKILVETNRILKEEGYYILTLPDGYLIPDQYKAFCKALEKFGFEVDKNISGRAEATDYKDVPFSIWLVAARKIGYPQTEDLSMDDFRFAFEAPKISHYKGDDGGNGRERRHEEDKLVKHEQFTILDPEDNFRPKGSPEEVLSRIRLGLKEAARKYGWEFEIRQRRGRQEIVTRK